MNVKTITMPKHEARTKLREYRRRIERVNNAQHRAEYEAVARGLSSLSRGLPLIDLNTVFAEAPHDEQGRPKLAVCQANRNQVYVTGREWWTNDRHRFTHFEPAGVTRTAARNPLVGMSYPMPSPRYVSDGYALVPMIPLHLRPERFDASAHHILWEVEAWSDRRLSARPDHDPLLLRHVGGAMFAVLAQWDLTELERMVMAGRARV